MAYDKAIIALLLLALMSPGAMADDRPLYLAKAGWLPRKHWWLLVPGKHYWMYKTEAGKEIIVYKKIEGVPDIRGFTDRSLPARWTLTALVLVNTIVAIVGISK